MPVTHFLVGCGKDKLAEHAPARDLYTGQLFRFARRYVEQQLAAEGNVGRWWILSAEHGLLDPSQVIAPYNRVLDDFDAAGIAAWGVRVAETIRCSGVIEAEDRLVVLAGRRYLAFRDGVVNPVEEPLAGLGIGARLGWFAQALRDATVASTPAPTSSIEPTAERPFPWIHQDLQHLARPLEQLTGHPRNARRHPKRNIDEIEASLRDHGQVRAAIVTTRPMILAGETLSPAGTLLVGNGMLRTARERLGWSHIAVLGFTGTDVDARKLALRDNRTSELAEWDYEPLGAELRELADFGVDLDAVGWSPDEAAPLLECDFSPGGAGPNPSPGAGAPGSGLAPHPTGGVGGSAKPGIYLTDAQREAVDRACGECRRRRNNPALTQAECLAIIAQEYVDAARPS